LSPPNRDGRCCRSTADFRRSTRSMGLRAQTHLSDCRGHCTACTTLGFGSVLVDNLSLVDETSPVSHAHGPRPPQPIVVQVVPECVYIAATPASTVVPSGSDDVVAVRVGAAILGVRLHKPYEKRRKQQSKRRHRALAVAVCGTVSKVAPPLRLCGSALAKRLPYSRVVYSFGSGAPFCFLSERENRERERESLHRSPMFFGQLFCGDVRAQALNVWMPDASKATMGYGADSSWTGIYSVTGRSSVQRASVSSHSPQICTSNGFNRLRAKWATSRVV
jgi:hypothetical protein